jgi:hypothetical protein
MRIRGVTGQRGAALGMVVLVAVCFSIAAFTALILALSRTRTKDFYKRRVVAHYAAEAGLVWAMQRLWADPSECFRGPNDLFIDPDGSGPLPSLPVQIKVPPPCTPFTVNKTLEATVSF